MGKMRPAQKPKKLTKEALRQNPWLGQLIRERLKELKAVREARKAAELDLD
jgi:hypothetical protein